MPRISAFYGIVIAMYHSEHGVPHFHAVHAEHHAVIAITDARCVSGSLPLNSMRLVRRWAAEHQAELEANWERARRGLPLDPIAPLP